MAGPVRDAPGSKARGEGQGGRSRGWPVDYEEAILADSLRVIERYHDAARYAMLRIVLAPCSPFSVSPQLMRESVALARRYNVHSHTHLAETRDEAAYCAEAFGCSPVALAEQLSWMGEDRGHAHMVH